MRSIPLQLWRLLETLCAIGARLVRFRTVDQAGMPRGLRLCSWILRLCPPGVRGKTRLARAVLKPWQEAENVVLRDRENSVFLIPSLREPMALHLLADGVFEPDVANLLREHLRPGGVFVDVGANIGIFTVMAAKRVGSSGKVIAIEPSLRVYPYLEHNVRGNDLENVVLRHCAAYSREASGLSFFEAPVHKFGMGALAPQFDAQPTTIRARPLDAIFAELGVDYVDVIKVDVEGFEADVFRGAKQLLTSRKPPLIVFEFADWAEARKPNGKVGDAQRVLLDFGYVLWGLSDFIKGRPALTGVITKDFAMIVAAKSGIHC